METTDFFNWVAIPLLIFISRMCDVTLGTLRHIFITKGYKLLVPILGFFEVLIWLIVIMQIMKNLNNVVCYIAWAGGFATGTYVGMMIEEKLALGLQVVRIITNLDCKDLVGKLSLENHGVTVMDGMGSKGPVKIILTVVERDEIDSVVNLIRIHHPAAFYSVEDIRDTRKGVFSNKSLKSSFLKRAFSKMK